MANYCFTNEALKVAMDRFGNNAPTREEPSVFSVGTGTTASAVTDTVIEEPIPFYSLESVDDFDVTTGWSDNADCTTSVNSTTFVEAAALDFTKDGTASATAYSEKTVTSLNYTSKKLGMWFYIKDSATMAKLAATAINVRYGSDSSNYYQFDILKASLSTGWNYIIKASTDASSTTGAPSLAAMDYVRVNFNSTLSSDTWAAGDIVVDYFHLASTDDYFNAFEAGYPVFDYTNYQLEIRTRLSSLQANGHLISESGILNEDATKKLITHITFTGFSKSQTDELIFVEKILFKNTEG